MVKELDSRHLLIALGTQMTEMIVRIDAQSDRTEKAHGVTAGRIEALSAQVDKMSGRIDSLSGQVNTLSGHVDQTAGRIDTLSGR